MDQSELETLVARGLLRRVPADRSVAEAYLATAADHLAAAEAVLQIDLAGAYALLYDAARKSVAAHMISHGLATTSRHGAHAAAGEYAMLLGTPELFRGFDRMRRNRNRSEYGVRSFSRTEVVADLQRSRAMWLAIRELLEESLGE
jgi:hypothetical protein